MNNSYYHLTAEANLAGILKDGLIPQFGNNSNIILDHRKAVFLCKEEDIAYWQIILGLPILLEVRDIDPSYEFEYSHYKEYLYEGIIQPEQITVITHNAETYRTKKVMTTLCSSYLIGLSMFTRACAYYYNNQLECTEEDMFAEAQSFTAVLDKLDYSVADMSEWQNYLKAFGEDGEYTFCDTYCNTETKLWQQLIKYPSDSLAEARQQIYDFIDKTFPFAKTLNTGGLEIYVRGEKQNGSEAERPSSIFD